MSNASRLPASDAEFLDAKPPLGERDTRREALFDHIEYVESELFWLKSAIEDEDLKSARKHFEELKDYVNALDDNLAERDENDSRADGGK